MNYSQAIIDSANRHGVAPSIALAVARQESGMQQYWQSGPRRGQLKVSSAGAIGIMQVMPSTAPGVDLADPQQNIEAGVSYLAEMYRQFGNWHDALAAYNWGPTRERAALQKRRTPPPAVANYVRNTEQPGQFAGTPAGGYAMQRPPASLTPKAAMGGTAAAIALYLLVLR